MSRSRPTDYDLNNEACAPLGPGRRKKMFERSVKGRLAGLFTARICPHKRCADLDWVPGSIFHERPARAKRRAAAL